MTGDQNFLACDSSYSTYKIFSHETLTWKYNTAGRIDLVLIAGAGTSRKMINQYLFNLNMHFLFANDSPKRDFLNSGKKL